MSRYNVVIFRLTEKDKAAARNAKLDDSDGMVRRDGTP